MSRDNPECPFEAHEAANAHFSCDGSRCYKCPFKTFDRIATALEKIASDKSSPKALEKLGKDIRLAVFDATRPTL